MLHNFTFSSFYSYCTEPYFKFNVTENKSYYRAKLEQVKILSTKKEKIQHKTFHVYIKHDTRYTASSYLFNTSATVA